MICAQSKDPDQQAGHPPSLIRVFAVRMEKPWVLSYLLSAQRRLWSDWVDAQADLSLRWAHMSFCWFCRVAAHLIPVRWHNNSFRQEPGAVARSEACPLSVQTASSSIPTSSTFFRSHEKNSTAILPLPLIQEEQLSVTGERMRTKYW